MPDNKHQHQEQSKQEGDFAPELTDHSMFHTSHTASSLPEPNSLSKQQKTRSI
jgi:hypothetical protein